MPSWKLELPGLGAQAGAWAPGIVTKLLLGNAVLEAGASWFGCPSSRLGTRENQGDEVEGRSLSAKTLC